MKHVIKSEFRKLLTIRTSYLLLALAMLLTGIITFMIEFKTLKGAPIPTNALTSTIFSATDAAGLFIMIAAVLAMTHEYRYNTIVYTLTSAKHRWQVLLAKALVVGTYASIFMVIVSFVAAVAFMLGTAARGDSLTAQSLDIVNLSWRVLFYAVASALYALVIAVLVRSVVVAMALVFAVINIVETLLLLLVKANYQYLPFTALGSVVTESNGYQLALQPDKAAIVTIMWLAALWTVAVILFIRRDAN